MTHLEAIEACLKLHSPDERGVCRCDRCGALRDLQRQLAKYIVDRGRSWGYPDGKGRKDSVQMTRLELTDRDVKMIIRCLIYAEDRARGLEVIYSQVPQVPLRAKAELKRADQIRKIRQRIKGQRK